jgi:hypothetical protein
MPSRLDGRVVPSILIAFCVDDSIKATPRITPTEQHRRKDDAGNGVIFFTDVALDGNCSTGSRHRCGAVLTKLTNARAWWIDKSPPV